MTASLGSQGSRISLAPGPSLRYRSILHMGPYQMSKRMQDGPGTACHFVQTLLAANAAAGGGDHQGACWLPSVPHQWQLWLLLRRKWGAMQGRIVHHMHPNVSADGARTGLCCQPFCLLQIIHQDMPKAYKLTLSGLIVGWHHAPLKQHSSGAFGHLTGGQALKPLD